MPRAIRVLGIVAAIALVAGLVMGFGVAPREVNQGNVQRIMYLHVPSVLTAYLAFAVTLVASIAYLATRSLSWDRWAAGAAEIGTIFTGVTLVSGSIWGKPTWGTWWTWDARLTLTLFLFFLFIGYLLLRSAVTDAGLRARYSAVLGICGLVLLPFIHLSVYFFRTLHPQPIVLKPSAPSLPGPMLVTLLCSVAVFTLLYVGFVMQRYGIAVVRDESEPRHG
jgi:heme exporter protein C